MRYTLSPLTPASSAALLAFGWFALVNLQTLQLLLDLAVALGQLRTDEVERIQRLLEREQVFASPVALQALGDFINARADARILHRAQNLTITFTGDNGSQNLLARLACHVRDDVGQLDVHLRQRLLHVLDVPALAL